MYATIQIIVAPNVTISSAKPKQDPGREGAQESRPHDDLLKVGRITIIRTPRCVYCAAAGEVP